jgi:translocation and assembly module TamB
LRKLLLYLGLAFAAAVLACFVGLYWLFGTTSGARFLLTTASGAAGVNLSAARVEGRVLDHLQLSGVRFKRQKLTAEVDTLDLYWEPDRLVTGDLLVHQLTLSGVRIQDDTPPTGKAPQLRWPQVSPLLSRFSGRVEKLRITGLKYRRLQGTPVAVSDLTSSLSLKDGLLTLSDLDLVSPQGRAKGELALGLSRPSLRVDLSAVPVRPLQGMDLFSLQGRLLPGRRSEFISGPIAAAARSGGAQRLELTADLGVTDNAFDFRRLSLFRPGRRGMLTGEGRLTLTAGEPLFNVSLRAKDLDLAAELKRPARISGFVNFSGSQSRYSGDLALSNVGPGWQSASLATQFKGGKDGARLAPISGAVLDGRISGALDIIWSEGMRVRGALAGRGLNPSRLSPEWRGVVNLDIAGNFEKPRTGVAKGALRGKLLESRLHGQDLKGELDGAFAGKNVRIDRLLLVARGFDLRGFGELEQRLNLLARVSDLSRLVPGSAGQLNADGWVRYRDGVFAGAAKGEGGNLSVAGARAASAKFDAALGAGPAYPVHLNAALASLKVGRLQVASALVTLDGTAARHTVNATLAAAQAQTQLTLRGGLEHKTWRGELVRFSGSDTVGPWSLAAPAALTANSSGFAVSPLVVNGVPGERAELAGALRRHPTSGDLRGSWSGINLARLNAWLQGVQFAGASSGNLALRLLPNDRVELNGHLEAKADVVTESQRVSLERVAANLEGGAQGMRVVMDLYLANAMGEGHLLFTSPRPATLALPEEGDLKLQLSNLDLALLRPLMQQNVQVNGKVAGVVSGRLLPGRRLDLRGNVALDQGTLAYRGEAEAFDATISTAELAFNWRGGTAGAKGGGGVLELNARAAANGVYTGKGQRIAISRCELRVDADQHGSRAAFDLGLDQGGVVRAALSSSAPATIGIPETGDFAMEWGGIDQKLIRPFLPGALNLEGELAGQARGRLLPGKRLEMTGEAAFSQGRANWRGTNGEMNARIRSATLDFVWRGETLSASLDLALAEYGKGRGNLVLPLPARLPVAPIENGPVHGGFSGSVQERGFLSAFLPGLVQESHGQLDLDLKIGGTWGDPTATGRLQLAKAGAYLPSAGIRVSDVQLLALLEGDQIRIDNFSATSGPGRLTGNLQAQLEGWQITGYSGSISGDRFQTVYLPELQMLTSPQLTFRGEGNTVSINGTIKVPQMLVAGPPVRPVVGPSKDVILEGEPPEKVAKKFPLLVEGRIHVALGDKVQVKASGIDALMGGEMDLVLHGLDNITSSGEIRVVKGSYKAYGMDLQIVRGRIYYVNDPVNEPTLDILALHTVGDVKAGVTVAGVVRAPVIKLYSEPPMADVDILAYMVLGHPLSSSSTDQASMVAAAASSLFSFGESESVQEQIKSRLGLSVLGVESVNTQSAGRMGYQEVPVTPSGAAPKPVTSQSLLTVGKYLTPKLYLSYGRSLVTGGSLFMLRYDIFKHWQVETQSGTESGADIYYKLEFD